MVNSDLMSDHLDDAFHYWYAAEKIIENTDTNSTEYLFRLEGPVNHLLGLSMEHLLKSIYIRIHGVNYTKTHHDIINIKLYCSQSGVLNQEFIFWVDFAGKDYKAHNFKYQRKFRGVPEDYEFDPANDVTNKFELGLVVKSPVEPIACLKAIKEQWEKELDIQRPIKEKTK